MRRDVNRASLAADKRREICVPTSAEAPFSPPDRAEICSSARNGLRRGAKPRGLSWEEPFSRRIPKHMGNPSLNDIVEGAASISQTIRQNFDITNVKNYITMDRPDGYRGMHLIANLGDGTNAEIQIRTPNQNLWAEWQHPFYKADTLGRLTPEAQDARDMVYSYARQMSDYYQQLDKGNMRVRMPECEELVRRVAGCLT